MNWRNYLLIIFFAIFWFVKWILTDVISQMLAGMSVIYLAWWHIHASVRSARHHKRCYVIKSRLASFLPENLRPIILWWLVNILIHSKTIEDHFRIVAGFFSFCALYNFKLHPDKCTILATTIFWCGRLLLAEVIALHQHRIDGIRNMAQPFTEADLQQLICAMQWMRSSIPKLSCVICRLANLLERVCSLDGKRTCLAVERVSLSALGGAPTMNNRLENVSLL